MHIGILANEGSWYVNDLLRAASARNHEVRRIDFTQLSGQIETARQAVLTGDCASSSASGFDAVIVRTMPPGSLEQVVFRMDALAMLAEGGTFVLNPPKAVECAVDKYLTTARLQLCGLPVPRTVVCEDSAAALRAFETLGGDVVVKPLFGAEGRGIVRVTDFEIALRTFRTLERIDSVLYVQEFIPHAFDTRVLILDGAVIGGMRRDSNKDFRTNVSQRGTATPVEITDVQSELAIRAAKATGTVFAGIDLLCGPDGKERVIEVNAVPGWRALARVTNSDIAGRLIEYLESRSPSLTA